MKLWLVFLHVFLVGCSVLASTYQDLTDNEFAEFEDFDSDEEIIPQENDDFKEAPHGSRDDFAQEDDQDMIIGLFPKYIFICNVKFISI